MTNDEALAEAIANVPADVHRLLTLAGFEPTGDAGNMWFYDRGDFDNGGLRLVIGEDGSDYPRYMADQVDCARYEHGESVLVCGGHLQGLCLSFIADDIVAVLGGAFHPDNRGYEYINLATGERTFNDEEAALYERRVEAICKYTYDPYEVAEAAIERWDGTQPVLQPKEKV